MKTLENVIETVKSLPGYKYATEENGVAMVYVCDSLYVDFQNAVFKMGKLYKSCFKPVVPFTMCFTFKLS